MLCPVCQKQVPSLKINPHLDSNCRRFLAGGSTNGHGPAADSSKSKQKQRWDQLFSAGTGSSASAKGKDKDKEKQEGGRDGKKVNEEFLNDIVDKLAKQVEQTSLEEKGEGPRNPASASTPTLSPTSGAASTATTSNTLSTSSDRTQGETFAPTQTRTQLQTHIEKRDKIGEGEGEEEK